MIIVDFSHLSMRNLYTAISQAKPKKDKKTKKLITSEYISFYKHLMLTSLRKIQKDFRDYGEIILAIDDRKYWRKRVFPDYKGHRASKRKESDINFEEFFKEVEEFVDALDKHFPYKVLKVEECEADDIIGVLCKEYGKYEKVMVVTSDKDMKQVLSLGAELYDPIQQRHIKMSDDEVNAYKLKHILLGDPGDNIPNIMAGTEFSDAFKSYLKKKDIYIEDVYMFNKMEISKKLYDEFKVYKKNRAGETTDEKDIFKPTRFGEKTAEKFAENLKENLKKNPLYAQNFARNKQLVLFSEIPEDIQKRVIDEYNKLDFKVNNTEIMNYLLKNNLQQQLMNISDFYITPEQNTARVDEWV